MFTIRKGAEALDGALAALPTDVRTSLLSAIKELIPLARRYGRTWDALADHPALKDALMDLAIPVITAVVRGKGAKVVGELVAAAPVLRAAIDEVAELAR